VKPDDSLPCSQQPTTGPCDKNFLICTWSMQTSWGDFVTIYQEVLFCATMLRTYNCLTLTCIIMGLA